MDFILHVKLKTSIYTTMYYRLIRNEILHEFTTFYTKRSSNSICIVFR